MPHPGQLLAVLCLLWLSVSVASAETMRFVYPPPETPDDLRSLYIWELLDAVLASNRQEYGDYEIIPYRQPMNHARMIAEVALGERGRINIIAPATSHELETRLRAIPLPIDKGLLGYRLFLIRQARQMELDQVRTLSDLQGLSIGQGSTWADARILKAAGFRLVLVNDYESLFKMLSAGRFDLFARGISEIEAEWRLRRERHPEIVIERNLILHYPMPIYYFVPRTAEGERMARRIEDGLNRLMRSGEFDRRYTAFKHRVLGGIDLRGRRILHIPNPELPDTAPLKDQRWWDPLQAELRPR